ncbi:hypothetical protein ABZ897_49975 [Nonomuraea sp. NPDC046802]|uniref:hypothetical protein n=1 Tax=Nonomuraea sp. NPDC046802 TaxID=3154919 RepID=UPI00340EC155
METGLRLFDEKGFEATTVAGICAAAEMPSTGRWQDSKHDAGVPDPACTTFRSVCAAGASVAAPCCRSCMPDRRLSGDGHQPTEAAGEVGTGS